MSVRLSGTSEPVFGRVAYFPVLDADAAATVVVVTVTVEFEAAADFVFVVDFVFAVAFGFGAAFTGAVGFGSCVTGGTGSGLRTALMVSRIFWLMATCPADVGCNWAPSLSYTTAPRTH